MEDVEKGTTFTAAEDTRLSADEEAGLVGDALTVGV